MTDFARMLIIIGLVIAFSGLVILIAIRFFPWFGEMPGDFRIERDNSRFYIPLASMILVSVLATILLNVVLRIFRR